MADDPDGYGTDATPGGWVRPASPWDEVDHWRRRALAAEAERDRLLAALLNLERND